jgi:hypothetical protein
LFVLGVEHTRKNILEEIEREAFGEELVYVKKNRRLLEKGLSDDEIAFIEQHYAEI